MGEFVLQDVLTIPRMRNDMRTLGRCPFPEPNGILRLWIAPSYHLALRCQLLLPYWAFMVMTQRIGLLMVSHHLLQLSALGVTRETEAAVMNWRYLPPPSQQHILSREGMARPARTGRHLTRTKGWIRRTRTFSSLS